MRKEFREYQIQRYYVYLYLIRYYIYIQYIDFQVSVRGEGLEENNYKEDLINSEAESCMPNAEGWNNDIYGMPTIWDYKTNPNNPTVVSNSLIGNTLLFHGRRYDPETNLYYYRARYYDPITGIFLSTDLMGYQDSMNLYQAFNMNGVNFLDPMGLTTYNVFFGFRKNERGKMTKSGKVFLFPEWSNLQKFVGKDDALNIIKIGENEELAVNGWKYSTSEIKRSLEAEDTETYFIGHGGHLPRNGRYVTVIVDKNIDDKSKSQLNKRVQSENDLVGIFTCSSSEYAADIVRGAKVVAVGSGSNRKSSSNALSSATYLFLKARLKGKNIEESIKEGNKAFKYSKLKKIFDDRNVGDLIDKGDKLIIYSSSQVYLILKSFNILK